jgi:hypothetical protein
MECMPKVPFSNNLGKIFCFFPATANLKGQQVNMVILLVVTPKEWLVLGLQSVGFDPICQKHCPQHEMNIECLFLARFGASPETHCSIFPICG